jgi:stearoyl-CoA desaturase (delta-9 desaturase)
MNMFGLILFCFSYYLLACIVLSSGYHRALSHRSVKFAGWLEKTMITLGLAAGTPVQWAGNHRFHHRHTDQPKDPHSPVQKGFWYAHCGWYIGTTNKLLCILYAVGGPFRTLFDAWWRPRTNQEHNSLAADIQEDPYYAWLSKPIPYSLILHLHIFLLGWFMYSMWGTVGLAALYVTYVVIYTIGDSADSIAHMFGERFDETVDHQARNNWFVGYFGGGEWHSNHHTYPSSAKMGLSPGQFDLSWEFIRLSKRLGMASRIKVTTQKGEHRIW